jgi:hypothetical protein
VEKPLQTIHVFLACSRLSLCFYGHLPFHQILQDLG